MNKWEMKQILDANGVEENVVYEMTDTGIGDLLGVEDTIQGWAVYYSERGRKDVLGLYPDENSACRALLDKVAQRMREDFGRVIVF